MLAPLRSCEEVVHGVCAPVSYALAEAFVPWADLKILVPALQEQAKAYKKCGGPYYPTTDAARVQAVASVNAALRIAAVAEVPIELEPAWTELFESGPKSNSTARRETGGHPSVLMLDVLAAKYKDRLSRLSAALDVGNEAVIRRSSTAREGIGVDATRDIASFGVWKVAVAQITRDPDPRRWDPKEVALLALKARAVSSGEAHRIGTPWSRHDSRETHYNRYRSLLSRAVGAKAALALLGEPIPWESPNRPSPDPRGILGGNLGDGPGSLQHFPYERSLYLKEWERLHPDGKVVLDGSIPEAELRARIIEETRYVESRWNDVERRAPRLDVEAVKSALRAIQSEEHDAAP